MAIRANRIEENKRIVSSERLNALLLFRKNDGGQLPKVILIPFFAHAAEISSSSFPKPPPA